MISSSNVTPNNIQRQCRKFLVTQTQTQTHAHLSSSSKNPQSLVSITNFIKFLAVDERPLTQDVKERIKNDPEAFGLDNPKFTIVWRSTRLYHVVC